MQGTIVRPAVVMRIDLAEPVRIWTGKRNIRLPADAVEDDATAVYLGQGFSDIPALQRLLNGDAAEYTLTVSGVPEEAVAFADAPDDFSGAMVHLGQFKFDQSWQPVGGVDWVTTLEAETVGVSTETDQEGNRTNRVFMTVSTALTDQGAAANIFWSEIEQREVAPTDRAFDYVNQYSIGSRRQFPA